MSNEITAPITIPAATEVSAPVTIGVQGAQGPQGDTGPAGADGVDGIDGELIDTFETVSRNLKVYPYTINRDAGGAVASIDYTTPGGTITKTINRDVDGAVASITYS